MPTTHVALPSDRDQTAQGRAGEEGEEMKQRHTRRLLLGKETQEAEVPRESQGRK